MHLKVPNINDQEVYLDVLYEEMSLFDSIHDVIFHVSETLSQFPYLYYSKRINCPSFPGWIGAISRPQICAII